MSPPAKHRHSIRELAQAAVNLTATELVKGIFGVAAVVLPLVASIMGGVWWISAEFTHAQNKLDKTADAVAEIAAKMDARQAESTAVHDRVIHLEDTVAWCCKSQTPKPAQAPTGRLTSTMVGAL